jgi:hypothetical protein
VPVSLLPKASTLQVEASCWVPTPRACFICNVLFPKVYMLSFASWSPMLGPHSKWISHLLCKTSLHSVNLTFWSLMFSSHSKSMFQLLRTSITSPQSVNFASWRLLLSSHSKIMFQLVCSVLVSLLSKVCTLRVEAPCWVPTPSGCLASN